ncbi:MAG TPA: hypothetical protein VLD55_11320 [Candidatus Sulfobium mesophilum]|nr:hypothetical protein [Candidatus Sulfobium mesophilum]
MDNRGLKEAIMKISRLTFIGFLISLFLASGAHTHDLSLACREAEGPVSAGGIF